jgi:hypothetical protein
VSESIIPIRTCEVCQAIYQGWHLCVPTPRLGPECDGIRAPDPDAVPQDGEWHPVWYKVPGTPLHPLAMSKHYAGGDNDPVSEARENVLALGGNEWPWHDSEWESFNASVDALIAAVRRTALEEAAAKITEMASSDDTTTHLDDCMCDFEGYDWRCFAAAIRRLAKEEA